MVNTSYKNVLNRVTNLAALNSGLVRLKCLLLEGQWGFDLRPHPVHTYPSKLCLFELSCLGTSLQKEGSLVVQILSDQLQGSVHLTQCVLHSDDMNPDPQKTVFVLFSCDTWKQLAMQVGAIVNIHPPWYVVNFQS